MNQNVCRNVDNIRSCKLLNLYKYYNGYNFRKCYNNTEQRISIGGTVLNVFFLNKQCNFTYLYCWSVHRLEMQLKKQVMVKKSFGFYVFSFPDFFRNRLC